MNESRTLVKLIDRCDILNSESRTRELSHGFNNSTKVVGDPRLWGG